MGSAADDPASERHPSHGPVLLFDGVCALCNWTVRVVLHLDRRGRIRFAPLEGDYAKGVFEGHPRAREVDSLVLVETSEEGGEGVRVKADAVLRMAHHLGGIWRVASVLRLVPRALRDWAYDLIARHRYALFGRYAKRPAPPIDTGSRFLD